jgi:hypothetical protein
LQRAYEGPYQVINKHEKHFKIQRAKGTDTISIYRIKVAYLATNEHQELFPSIYKNYLNDNLLPCHTIHLSIIPATKQQIGTQQQQQTTSQQSKLTSTPQNFLNSNETNNRPITTVQKTSYTSYNQQQHTHPAYISKCGRKCKPKVLFNV